MTEAQNKEEIYIEAMILIAGLSQNDSVSAVFDKISKIPEDLTLKDAILVELDKNRIFPESFMKIITFLIFILSERAEINRLYEESMERYETINKLTSKGRPTEDEAKIKKTLTDFILKIESFYEMHDKAGDAAIKELNRHMNELNIKHNIDREILHYKISPRSFAQIQPHLITLLEVYFNYKKNKGILKRLIKISNYIIEDALKKA